MPTTRQELKEPSYEDGEDPGQVFAQDCTEAGYAVEHCQAGGYYGPGVRCAKPKEVVAVIRATKTPVNFDKTAKGYIVFPYCQ